MKRFLILCMVLCMSFSCTLAETNGSAGSWGQINQSLEKGTDWVRYVENPTDFQISAGLFLRNENPQIFIAIKMSIRRCSNIP